MKTEELNKYIFADLVMKKANTYLVARLTDASEAARVATQEECTLTERDIDDALRDLHKAATEIQKKQEQFFGLRAML